MPLVDSKGNAGPDSAEFRLPANIRLHRAWQAATTATIAFGLFHLINLVGPGRAGLGPALVTPFRTAFVVSWMLLAAGYIAGRRWPRLDMVDALVAALAAVFLLRGAFTPETLGMTVNWVVTGAGTFFLIKHGVRSKGDVRLLTAVIAIAVVSLSLVGVAEYAAKRNPIFDAIQVEVIGTDTRIDASSQFYRVRSLIGHPGFVGAVMSGAAPLIMLALWRRRLLLAASLLLVAAAVFLSFSRGSWLLAAAIYTPLLAYRGRFWLARHARWLVPALVLPAALITIDFLRLEKVWTHLGEIRVEEGLAWTETRDGPYTVVKGEAGGITPINKFLYFNVGDDFYRGERGSVTVIVRFFDQGRGAMHVEYDSWDENANEGGVYALSGYVQKADSRTRTSAAFFLADARLDGRQNGGADFRIVDDDSQVIIDEVILQKGRLKLPTVIAQQWASRAGSISTRADLHPLAWAVFKDNPLGVGLYNSPGTNNRAVDSLPLTWMMEFGWLAAPLLALLIAGLAWEGFLVIKNRSGPAVALYVSLAVLLLHGGHLMVLYDKPSLVLFSAVGALYALVRPWRRQGPVIDMKNRECML
ncbi:MAG: O-antigen ligase family protein [Thermoleophilia bacterium]|nr:O-antigen ligase family protein [Thermoleophilia bacterium]